MFTQACQRCSGGPAIAYLPAALFSRTCATCARLGGCPESIIREGLSAQGPDRLETGLNAKRAASVS